MWEVEFTDEFGEWWDQQTAEAQESIAASVELLRLLGPNLPRPHADTLKGTKLSNLKELRVQHAGHPVRILFAFDPRRCAILLMGGDKTGDNDFYRRLIPVAEKLYSAHLESLREEGLI